jgi:hypothetical protein
VTFVLKEYLKQTAALRKDCKKLFISNVKPHGRTLLAVIIAINMTNFKVKSFNEINLMGDNFRK